jgi:hypothetical protein
MPRVSAARRCLLPKLPALVVVAVLGIPSAAGASDICRRIDIEREAAPS